MYMYRVSLKEAILSPQPSTRREPTPAATNEEIFSNLTVPSQPERVSN